LIVCDRLGVHDLPDSGVFLAAYVLVIYAAGRYSFGRNARVNAGVVAVAFVLAVVDPAQPFSPSDAAFLAVAFAGPFVAGQAIRRRLERETRLERRAVELERERDAKAREAVAQAQVRIARELHDVVAHAISVTVLQARGGRRGLATNADETRRARPAAEPGPDRRPAGNPRRQRPARRPRDRGRALPVDLAIEGEPFQLPPGVDVSALRIVQEALT
jgi:signal transduction histidine kinase